MGICSLCASPERERSSPTTMVIMEDGKLLELAGPARTAQVLFRGCESFVCDADDMEFDGYVLAMGAEEELRPGQLYFVLPRSMLKRRLHPEEMASLAVRASAALLESGSVAVFGPPAGGGGGAAPAGASSAGTEEVERSRTGMGRGGMGCNFGSTLGAIPE